MASGTSLSRDEFRCGSMGTSTLLSALALPKTQEDTPPKPLSHSQFLTATRFLRGSHQPRHCQHHPMVHRSRSWMTLYEGAARSTSLTPASRSASTETQQRPFFCRGVNRRRPEPGWSPGTIWLRSPSGGGPSRFLESRSSPSLLANQPWYCFARSSTDDESPGVPAAISLHALGSSVPTANTPAMPRPRQEWEVPLALR